jgi:hypothetical protein
VTQKMSRERRFRRSRGIVETNREKVAAPACIAGAVSSVARQGEPAGLVAIRLAASRGVINLCCALRDQPDDVFKAETVASARRRLPFSAPGLF